MVYPGKKVYNGSRNVEGLRREERDSYDLF